jgi:hypothetical protein
VNVSSPSGSESAAVWNVTGTVVALAATATVSPVLAV